MNKLKEVIIKAGYVIESSESDIGFISFYCNKDNKRYFVKIIQKR